MLQLYSIIHFLYYILVWQNRVGGGGFSNFLQLIFSAGRENNKHKIEVVTKNRLILNIKKRIDSSSKQFIVSITLPQRNANYKHTVDKRI